jgi:Transposase
MSKGHFDALLADFLDHAKGKKIFAQDRMAARRSGVSGQDSGVRRAGMALAIRPYAIQRFARTLRRDIKAARNAVTEPWSNGQTEGQINRLKTLNRAMYGRASPELLHARMLPL